MHLRRAFDDFQDLRVPVIAGHGCRSVASRGAVDLHCVGGGAHRCARRKVLGDEHGFDGFRQALFGRPAGLVAESARGRKIGAHSCDQRPDHPEIAGSGAVDSSARGIRRTLLKAAAKQAQRRAGGTEPGKVQSVLGDVRQGEPRLADDIRGRNPDILEMHLRKSGGAKPHQVSNRFDRQAGAVSRHQACHRALAELCEHEEDVGELRPADPLLGAVQHEATGARGKVRGDRLDGASGRWLGQREACRHAAFREGVEPGALLFGAAPLEKGCRDHGLHGQHVGQGGAEPSERFVQQPERDEVPPRSTEFARDDASEIPRPRELLDHVVRNPLVVVPIGGERRDLESRERRELLLPGVLQIVQAHSANCPRPLRCPSFVARRQQLH